MVRAVYFRYKITVDAFFYAERYVNIEREHYCVILSELKIFMDCRTLELISDWRKLFLYANRTRHI
jgi:hypothetical protein